MPISTTLRRLDGDIYVNADGILTDKFGVPLSQTGNVTPQQFGAVGDGVTNDTAAFQAAINTGKRVFVPYTTNGYVVGNLTLLNGTFIQGLGAKLIYLSTITTGVMFNCSTLSNVHISGLTLAGGLTSKPTSVGTRTAIIMNAYGTNNVVEDVYALGFSGIAFQFYGLQDASLLYPLNATFANCQAQWCGCGALFTYYVGPIYQADYMRAMGCLFNYCYKGVEIVSANISLVGCSITGNTIGVTHTASSSGGHGNAIGCMINHNTLWGIEATDLTTGFNYCGCTCYEGGISLTNSSGLTFENGILDVGLIHVDGGGANYIRNNRKTASHNNTLEYVNGANPKTYYGNYQVSGSDGLPITNPGVMAVYKTASESRNTTTTLANDTDLAIANLVAGKTYEIELMLNFRSVSADTGWQWGLSLPALHSDNIAMHIATFGKNGASPTVNCQKQGEWSTTGAAVLAMNTAPAGTNSFSHSKMIVKLSASGTAQLLWSQFSSNAVNLTLQAGSFMIIRQLD